MHRVRAQVAEAVSAHAAVDGAAGAARADELLATAGLDPSADGHAYPHQLSGGQRQRVAIAIAIAHEPDLIVADEPTSALDSVAQRSVLDMLDDVRASTGAALALITHDLTVAAARVGRIVVLRRGEVVEDGPTEQVLDRPGRAYTAGLVAAHRRLARGSSAPVSPDRDRPVVLSATDVVKRFPPRRGGASPGPLAREVTALSGVSLDVHAGEIVALVGASGAGKSTLARVLIGLRVPDQGAVSYRGEDLATMSRRRRRSIRGDLQLVPQDPYASLDPRMSVGAIVAEPLRVRGVPRDRRRERVAELLAAVHLGGDGADRFPHQFSAGQRQRIAIARALATRPAVVVLDEPVSGLDASLRAGLLDLLVDVQRESGFAGLLATHDLAVARHLASRIVILHRGAVVEEGPAEELLARPTSPRTQELIAAASWPGAPAPG